MILHMVKMHSVALTVATAVRLLLVATTMAMRMISLMLVLGCVASCLSSVWIHLAIGPLCSFKPSSHPEYLLPTGSSPQFVNVRGHPRLNSKPCLILKAYTWRIMGLSKYGHKYLK